MSAPRTTLLVTLASLILAACTPRVRPATAPVVTAVHFANQSRERVDVYLVTPEREWHLGRVESLQARWLALPGEWLSAAAGTARLAVIPAAAISLRPSRERGVVISILQPVGDLLGQQWMYVGGQLSSQRRPRGV